jgi:hypothetical protein
MAKNCKIKETKAETKERLGNFQWLATQNLSDFEGKWISVINKIIVSSGTDLRTVMAETRKKFPGKVPFITRVPAGLVSV